MKDMQASLEKLRTDAAEAALIRDLTTDRWMREMYTRLAEHFATLAAEVEREIATTYRDLRRASASRPRRAFREGRASPYPLPTKRPSKADRQGF